MERVKGFEPSTACLEGRNSSHWVTPALVIEKWWWEEESNLWTHREQIYSLPSLATWLSHHLIFWSNTVSNIRFQWCCHEDLNPGPADYKSAALANWAMAATKLSQNYRQKDFLCQGFVYEILKFIKNISICHTLMHYFTIIV